MCTDAHYSEPNHQFHPVILFHDYTYAKDATQYHIHIPCDDVYYQPFIQVKKKKMHEMLKANSRAWQHIINHKESDHVTAFTSSASYTATGAWTEPFPALSFSSSPSFSFSSTSSPRHDYSLSPSLSGTATPFQHGQSQSLSQYSQDRYVAKGNGQYDHVNNRYSEMTQRKRRGNLPKDVTLILKQWLADHCCQPYPTDDEKAHLRAKTGLTLNQISNWFINARRRILPLILARSQHVCHVKPSEGMDELSDMHTLRRQVRTRRKLRSPLRRKAPRTTVA